jgi:hypothetical protein
MVSFPQYDVIFICKKRSLDYTHEIKDSGLRNSATFCSRELENKGISSQVFIAVDNNSIDGIVHRHKPKYVVIEALWVVPDKFEILIKRHPTVKWIIRIHSEFTFLSNEGNAIDWLVKYFAYPEIILSGNTKKLNSDLIALMKGSYPNMSERRISKRCWYLPNCYQEINVPIHEPFSRRKRHQLHIGCFGAIRPMKNQLAQAQAAIMFADSLGVKLFFHMNTDRIEQRGEQVLKNIRAMFGHNTRHVLKEHTWLPQRDFLELISRMDISMQVSLTETFNIVTADAVSKGVSVVVSEEVSWLPSFNMVYDPTDIRSITKRLESVWRWRNALPKLNKWYLDEHIENASQAWKEQFKSLIKDDKGDYWIHPDFF